MKNSNFSFYWVLLVIKNSLTFDFQKENLLKPWKNHAWGVGFTLVVFISFHFFFRGTMCTRTQKYIANLTYAVDVLQREYIYMHSVTTKIYYACSLWNPESLWLIYPSALWTLPCLTIDQIYSGVPYLLGPLIF